ncbi:MAG: PilZ domain-containing protein [Deltaproteobacteria bacterium]|nr:PilZ domain-containing protein [Deltaproteobacteria bacterium]
MSDTNRRKHARYEVSLNARIKINLFNTNSTKVMHDIQEIVGIVDTKDISIGGLNLTIVGSPMAAGMSFTPATAGRLVGRPIEVKFDNYDLNIWGEVIRIDPKSMLVAVVISKVSDLGLWKELCENNTDKGISIFPEEWRQRARKKREF